MSFNRPSQIVKMLILSSGVIFPLLAPISGHSFTGFANWTQRSTGCATAFSDGFEIASPYSGWTASGHSTNARDTVTYNSGTSSARITYWAGGGTIGTLTQSFTLTGCTTLSVDVKASDPTAQCSVKVGANTYTYNNTSWATKTIDITGNVGSVSITLQNGNTYQCNFDSFSFH